MFVSYAQNGEDIVLWRALKHITNGTYVDVGAADPENSSVTKAFYDRGWSGVNVVPSPAFAKRLQEQRPRDRTFQCGASDRTEEADFYVVDDTGLSTLDASLVPSINERGFEATAMRVQLRTLDDILDEAGYEERPIHFLKIDVEGAESDVISGLSLSVWRPWVLVVEATRPMSTSQNHEEWEAKVLSAGYVYCLFDGLNRYYVAPEHPELVADASYPVCIFDSPYRSVVLDENSDSSRREGEAAVARQGQLEAELESRELYVRDVTARIEKLAADNNATMADAVRWRDEAIRWRASMLDSNESAKVANRTAAEFAAVAAHAQELSESRREHLETVAHSISWRATRPLRLVGWLRRRRSTRPSGDTVTSATTSPPRKPTVTRPSAKGDLTRRFCARVATVTGLLDPKQPAVARDLREAILGFVRAVDGSDISAMAKGWLAMVAVAGSYPTEVALEQAARAYRTGGGRALSDLMLNQLESLSLNPASIESDLEVIRGGVLVDVSHTAAHDLHTGIQRVVREFVSRWLSRPNVILVQWNFSTSSMKRLADSEVDRLRDWRRWVHEAGTVVTARPLQEFSGKTVIPWESILVLPELVANPPTCDGYRSLARSGLVERCSLIGYDTVPMTATETVTDGMTANFGHYLALVKHSTHLAAISEAACVEFQGFEAMLQSQGLSGPRLTAQPLPTEVPVLSADDLEAARMEFHIGSVPVVVVVGSHEPRKNHMVVLEAAESIWRAGLSFDLVFAGGSGWGGSAFADYVKLLAGQGRPVRVYERVGEKSLWALYRLAEFSVFPSLLEGYGLPIAESLASGTPVVTSSHGSMKEIAAGGGALLVDPRDVAQLAQAMKELLTDEDRRSELRAGAAARVFPTWDGYADALWTNLVGLN